MRKLTDGVEIVWDEEEEKVKILLSEDEAREWGSMLSAFSMFTKHPTNGRLSRWGEAIYNAIPEDDDDS